MDEEERNPFTLPSDEEVFKMRDEEKRRKQEYRETQSKLRVWEKTTRGKLPTGAERLRQLIGEEAAAKPKTRKAKVKGEGSLAKQPDALERRGERECMADFLAKKKEMFYTHDLGVPLFRDGFTPSTRLVSRRGARGWFLCRI